MLEKIKSWGIVAGIAAISILLFLLRYKSNKLEATKYKLLMKENEEKSKKLKEELAVIDRKVAAGMAGYQEVKEVLQTKVELLNDEHEEFYDLYLDLTSNSIPKQS